MKIYGKNRSGKPTNTCKPRKNSAKRTNAEVRLKKRQESFDKTMQFKPTGPLYKGYHRPGSLKG